jgi:hypothetical protein
MITTGIPFLGVVAVLSFLLPVVAGAGRLSILDLKERLAFLLVVVQALDALGQMVLAHLAINNLWLIHIYLLIEVPLLLIVYGIAWESESSKSLAWSISVVFILVWFASKFTIEPLNKHSIYISPASRGLICILSAYTIFRISQLSKSSVLRLPMFWFGATTMLFNAGSLMFYALSRIILTSLTEDEIIRVYSLFWGFTIFVNFLFAWAFLCKPFPLKSGGQLDSAR